MNRIHKSPVNPWGESRRKYIAVIKQRYYASPHFYEVYRFGIGSSDGKYLIRKNFRKLKEAVTFRNKWLKKNNPALLKIVKRDEKFVPVRYVL